MKYNGGLHEGDGGDREKWMNSRDTYEVKLLDLNDRLNLWGMRKISKIILKL